jgi:hypothetical protein
MNKKLKIVAVIYLGIGAVLVTRLFLNRQADPEGSALTPLPATTWIKYLLLWPTQLKIA